MTRLTVHVENAPFVERERKSLGKNDQGVETFKPKTESTAKKGIDAALDGLE